tara:strand:+ start:1338 stop:1586 length:249 start_codon:yes stop_codon:yes gene_type:complete
LEVVLTAGMRVGAVVTVAATTEGAMMVADLGVKVLTAEGTSAAARELAAKVVDAQEGLGAKVVAGMDSVGFVEAQGAGTTAA